MIRPPLILPLLAVLLAPGFQSCAFRPAIDAEGRVTVRQPGKLMLRHGARKFRQEKQNRPTTTDPRFTRPVMRVASRLEKVIDMPGADWEFVIFTDHSPNAFALPGGKVGINTGLLKLIGDGPESEALLAAVLGHEISHATSNHAGIRMWRGLALGTLAAVLWTSLEHNGTRHPGYCVTGFGLGCYLANSLPLSRRQEYESDKIGAIYMAKAGYDPRMSIELWRRLRAYHIRQGGQKPLYLRTHPPDDSRIKALEQFMPVAIRYYSRP